MVLWIDDIISNSDHVLHLNKALYGYLMRFYSCGNEIGKETGLITPYCENLEQIGTVNNTALRKQLPINPRYDGKIRERISKAHAGEFSLTILAIGANLPPRTFLYSKDVCKL